MARDPRKLLGRLRWALRQRGLVGTLLLVGRTLRGGSSSSAIVHPFDREHGVETSGLIGGAALGGGHRHASLATAYFGVPPSRMRRLLSLWRATEGVLPVQEVTFCDVGCGKGRALLLASELPFRAAVGTEIDSGLTLLAKANLAQWTEAGRARCPVRIVCGDAATVELPVGPLLVYLYNPFRAPVLRQLLAALERRGGSIDVLYLYPEEEAAFPDFPRFELLWAEGVALDPEDVGVDEISAQEDPCRAYRLRC